MPVAGSEPPDESLLDEDEPLVAGVVVLLAVVSGAELLVVDEAELGVEGDEDELDDGVLGADAEPELEDEDEEDDEEDWWWPVPASGSTYC